MTPSKQTALVTGASVGIGRDLAVVLAEHGHDLVLTARDQSKLEKLADELRAAHRIRVEMIPLDLSRPQAPAELFAELARRDIQIDLLINNAGFGAYGRFDQRNPDDLLGMIHVNITALTHLTRLFLPAMVARGRGRIMNVSSIAAFQPGPLMAVYYASKSYVLSFSEAIGTELKRTGVTVTALCPGPTRTEFQSRAGVQTALAFNQRVMMDSMKVARIGYTAMMVGKRVVITGWRNRLMSRISRIAPRRLVLSIVKKMNEARG